MKNLNTLFKKINTSFFIKTNIQLYDYKSFFFKNYNSKWNKKDLNKKFNNLFLKNGLALKGLNFLNKSFYLFYLFFFKKNSLNHFSKYSDFEIFLKNDNNFFQKQFLLTRLENLLSSMFSLKIEKISKKLKKLKKNLKIKYKYKICYIPRNSRQVIWLKQFLIYINTLKFFDIHVRVVETLLNTILEDKSSFLYRQKITLIKKFRH